jgi:hypothetical protein
MPTPAEPVAPVRGATVPLAPRRERLREAEWFLPWLLCLGLTLVAYGSSLHAGIMFDAALDLPRATERGWTDVLTSAGASPYYRPITLLLWKACYTILGRNDFVVLHGLSLASHVVCGWLVYQLAKRLADVPTGVAAAALFLWFPLSYQVVGFVDSLFHSLAALWVLAAAVLYWDGRRASSRARLAGALACGALALLTHEGTAALLTPAILGLELLRRRRVSLWPVAFVGETAAFVAIWLAVPRWPSTPKPDFPSLQLNAAYFLQAIAYPLTMLLGHLPRRGGGDVAEVVGVSAATLVGLVALAAARRRLAVAGFAMLWFGAALVLPAFLLPWPNYVIDAPRLLYGASAGIALLWGLTLASKRPWGVLGLAAIVAVLAESYAFVGVREKLLDQGANVVRQLIDTATQSQPEAGRTYINVPAFLGPKDSDFLLGHAGVTMLPDYFGLDLEVAAATGQHPPIDSLSYDDLARPWDEAYGLQGQHGGLQEATASVAKGGGVYVTRFEPGAIRLEYAGRVAQAPLAPLVARFGDWAALERANADIQGDTLAIHLVWRALAKAPGDYTVFVHVVGDALQPLVQSDGYPVAGLLPPRDWAPGAEVYDERRIPLPATARGRPPRVLVGLYDRAAPTTRAQVFDATGGRVADDALSIAVGDSR